MLQWIEKFFKKEEVAYEKDGMIYFKRKGQWFKRFPGEVNPIIPVIKPKSYSTLYLWWLKVSPECYKTYRRNKSQSKFLDKCGVPKHSGIREIFGKPIFIETEKRRVRALPPPEIYFNNFDYIGGNGPSVRETIKLAIKEVKGRANGQVR